ncbi:hypothetical protein [Paenibacillus sp. 1781tsa1]|uniref:hypothetical protein n=1 Tax=Paenibacillus sp. 1781tsa1 TaxID=2953810 RepID=UPI0020A1C323|nr:hypothetical protein [Paenibacillus sp. 1781tsa1]MCP1182935.1 hypothetical protein [Paenibacillus sp. 1781tsa1]
MKNLFRVPFLLLAIFTLAFSTIFPTYASANSNTTVPTEAQPSKATVSSEQPSPVVKNKNGTIIPMASSDVAVLTLFSVPNGSTNSSGGSTGSNWGTHSFITVKNVSSSNISVGGLSGIASNKTISVGTWGNKSENEGIFYNLEAKFISENSYNNRVSRSMYLTQSQLNSVNSYIRSHDSWSSLNNCSSFAVGLWNSVSTDTYTAGFPNTPQNLYNSLRDGAYTTNAAVPYDYLVYYSDEPNAPKRSNQF